MKRGNIIRFTIDREKYHLPPTTAHYGNILVGSILKIHAKVIDVKAMDIWGTCDVKYFTIPKSNVVAVL